MRRTFPRSLGTALLSTLIAAVTILALATLTLSEALADEERNVRDSIIYIEGGLSFGDKWVPYGSATACFVGVEGEDPSYLVTDDHLIETFEHFGSGAPTSAKVGDDHHKLIGHSAIRAYWRGEPFVEAYLVDYDEQSGLVLLKTDRPCEGGVPLGVHILGEEDDVDAEGTRMLVVGYPGFLDEAPDVKNVSANFLEPYVQVAHISKMNTISASGVRVIWHDAQIVNGNTGGPIIDDNGALVAVNTWGDGHQNYGINAVEVKELLDLNGVEYEMADSASDTDDDEATANTDSTETDTVTTVEDDTATEDETAAKDEELPQDEEKPTDEKTSLISVTSNVPLPIVAAIIAAIVLVIVFIVCFPRLRNKQ